MKKNWKVFLPILIVMILVATVVPMGLTTSALTLQEGAEAAKCSECPSDLFGETGVFRQITDVVIYIAGAVAVVMLIIGGIRYVVSGGDAKKVTDAKNTVLYAIIGLVICFFSYAIVHFVINALPNSDSQVNTSGQSVVLIDKAKG
ncbi:hypothetical protein IKG60_01635 [Candidatus Saccharibacteria bacterium]|nr:hypothetical protein [Candidatus Saccharibacteria bacterium]